MLLGFSQIVSRIGELDQQIETLLTTRKSLLLDAKYYVHRALNLSPGTIHKAQEMLEKMEARYPNPTLPVDASKFSKLLEDQNKMMFSHRQEDESKVFFFFFFV